MTYRRGITEIDGRLEHRVLIACTSLPMTSDRVDELRSLLRAGIDWDYLLRIGNDHKMAPVLAKQLISHFADGVPQLILRELQESVVQNTYRNLWQTSEVHRLIHLFAEQGVRAAPYKGPILASVAYGDIACRSFGDLDILIRPYDFQLVQRILLAEQYKPYYNLTVSQTAAFVRYQCESVFQRSSNGFTLDLHWGIRLSYSIIDLGRAGLWDRLKPVMLAGKPILALSPEDSLLLLAIHGIAHRWRSLGLVMDMGQSLQVHRGVLDWTLIWREAARWNIQRILLLAIGLARDLTGAELPPELSSRIDGDPTVIKLTHQIGTELFLPPRETPALEDLPFHLRIRERRRDQAQCLIDVMTLPSVREITLLPFPPPLFPFYRILRALRLMAKYLILGLQRIVSHASI